MTIERHSGAVRTGEAGMTMPLCLLLSGCAGWQSALDPQGPHAQHIASTIWLFIGVCTAVWLAVMVGLALRWCGAGPSAPNH